MRVPRPYQFPSLRQSPERLFQLTILPCDFLLLVVHLFLLCSRGKGEKVRLKVFLSMAIFCGCLCPKVTLRKCLMVTIALYGTLLVLPQACIVAPAPSHGTTQAYVGFAHRAADFQCSRC